MYARATQLMELIVLRSSPIVKSAVATMVVSMRERNSPKHILETYVRSLVLGMETTYEIKRQVSCHLGRTGPFGAPGGPRGGAAGGPRGGVSVRVPSSITRTLSLAGEGESSFSDIAVMMLYIHVKIRIVI